MSSRVRKQSDCPPPGKQGPMRATLPVSSVMKQTGGLRKSCTNSPTLSPTNVWRRVSPEHALSGQRSPGAVNYKGRGKYICSGIRRTASLDTLCSRGHWPRELYMYAGHLQVDKATQTEELYNSGFTSGRSSRCSNDDKLDRFLRSRLQRTPLKSCNNTDHGSQTMSPGFYGPRYSTGSVPLRATRSSVEGLNQEIERLVLCPIGGSQSSHLDRLSAKTTPEGHRAPLAELLRRSVNTQTPLELTHSSGGSVCSSPDMESSKLGTSPHINRFLAREPPDGCEKVNLKATEPTSAPKFMSIEPLPMCLKPSVTGFQLRPSQGSAFQPLQPNIEIGSGDHYQVNRRSSKVKENIASGDE